MKKFQYLFAAGVLSMTFAGCAHYTVDAPVMGIANNSINTYVAADLDYQGAKKVSADVDKKKLFGFISLSRNGDKQLTNTNRYKGLSKTQCQALYRAKTNNDVDIIMEPEFTTETHSWFFGAYTSRKGNVKGWGVNMKGIKEDTHRNSVKNFRETGFFK